MIKKTIEECENGRLIVRFQSVRTHRVVAVS